MKTRARAGLLLSAAALLATLPAIALAGDDSKPAGADLASFQAWAEAFVQKPHADVLLPDAPKWFAAHFEPGLARKLADEYATMATAIQGLPQAIAKQQQAGKTDLLVGRVASAAIDPHANGLQNAALQRMTTPAALFQLTLVKPGMKSGWRLWSFVQADGKFYYVGKMAALKPAQSDLATDVLCQLPLETAEKMLREKGLLKTSAVEYLTQRGVLIGPASGGATANGLGQPPAQEAAWLSKVQPDAKSYMRVGLWRLGTDVTTLAIGTARRLDNLKPLQADTERLCKAFGLDMPPLADQNGKPIAESEDQAARMAAAMNYALVVAGRSFAPKIAAKYGDAGVAAFEFGLKSTLLPFAPKPSAAADALARAATKAEWPEPLWRPLIDTLRADGDTEAVLTQLKNTRVLMRAYAEKLRSK